MKPLLLFFLCATAAIAAGIDGNALGYATFPLYFNGDISQYVRAFTAMSMILKSPEYVAVWGTVGLTAVFLGGTKTGLTGDLSHIGVNLGAYFLISGTIFFSPCTVMLNDNRVYTHPNLYSVVTAPYNGMTYADVGLSSTFEAVDNVPWVLGAMVWASNSIGNFATNIIESTLSDDSDALGLTALGYGKQTTLLANVITKTDLGQLATSNKFATMTNSYMNNCMIWYAKADPFGVTSILDASSNLIQDMSPTSLDGNPNLSVDYTDANGSGILGGTCGELYAKLLAGSAAAKAGLVTANGVKGQINMDPVLTSMNLTAGLQSSGDANLYSAALLNIGLAKSYSKALSNSQTGLTTASTGDLVSKMSQSQMQNTGIMIGMFLNENIPGAVIMMEAVVIVLFPLALIGIGMTGAYRNLITYFMTLMSFELVQPGLAIAQNLTNQDIARRVLDNIINASPDSTLPTSLANLPEYYNQVLNAAGMGGIMAMAAVSLTISIVFFGGNAMAGMMVSSIQGYMQSADQASQNASVGIGEADQAERSGNGNDGYRNRTYAGWRQGLNEMNQSWGAHIQAQQAGDYNRHSQGQAIAQAGAEIASGQEIGRQGMQNFVNGAANQSRMQVATQAETGQADGNALVKGAINQTAMQNQGLATTGTFDKNDLKKGVEINTAGQMATLTTAGKQDMAHILTMATQQQETQNAVTKIKARMLEQKPELKNKLIEQAETEARGEVLTKEKLHDTYTREEQNDSQVGAASANMASAVETTKGFGGVDAQADYAGKQASMSAITQKNTLDTAESKAKEKGKTLNDLATTQGKRAGGQMFASAQGFDETKDALNKEIQNTRVQTKSGIDSTNAAINKFGESTYLGLQNQKATGDISALNAEVKAAEAEGYKYDDYRADASKLSTGTNARVMKAEGVNHMIDVNAQSQIKQLDTQAINEAADHKAGNIDKSGHLTKQGAFAAKMRADGISAVTKYEGDEAHGKFSQEQAQKAVEQMHNEGADLDTLIKDGLIDGHGKASSGEKYAKAKALAEAGSSTAMMTLSDGTSMAVQQSASTGAARVSTVDSSTNTMKGHRNDNAVFGELAAKMGLGDAWGTAKAIGGGIMGVASVAVMAKMAKGGKHAGGLAEAAEHHSGAAAEALTKNSGGIFNKATTTWEKTMEKLGFGSKTPIFEAVDRTGNLTKSVGGFEHGGSASSGGLFGNVAKEAPAVEALAARELSTVKNEFGQYAGMTRGESKALDTQLSNASSTGARLEILHGDMVQNIEKAEKAMAPAIHGTAEAGKAATHGMAEIATKGAARMGGHALGILGVGMSLTAMATDAKAGDWAGVGFGAASTVAGFIPGLGTGTALAIDAADMGRRVYNEKHAEAPVITPHSERPGGGQSLKPSQADIKPVLPDARPTK
jgi:TraG-like protein, N-terminal region